MAATKLKQVAKATKENVMAELEAAIDDDAVFLRPLSRRGPAQTTGRWAPYASKPRIPRPCME